MRILCYFDNRFEPPAPFIKAMLESKALGIRKPVCFHVDTGASATILLDKDIHYLGVAMERLRESERKIGGIGGSIQTYAIENTVLLFREESGEIVKETLNLLAGVHDLSKLSSEEKSLVMRMPSLLGRDIIYKYRFVCDKNRNEAYLER
ncbi:MAG: hypothetical protein ACUVQY_09955 [Thermoproteota archaeon]